MELDLHIHSKYSYDSISEPKLILKIARKKNLGAVAITDHNTIKGGIKGSKEKISGVSCIVGSEISTEKGDIIGLFLNEEIKSKEVYEVIEEIRSQGGVSILAHPFKWTSQIDEEVAKRVDCIEVLNGRISKDANLLAQSYVSVNGFSATAGSDSHLYLEIGCARMALNNNVTDLEELREAILENNVIITGKESSRYYRLLSGTIKVLKTKKMPKKVRRLFNR